MLYQLVIRRNNVISRETRKGNKVLTYCKGVISRPLKTRVKKICYGSLALYCKSLFMILLFYKTYNLNIIQYSSLTGKYLVIRQNNVISRVTRRYDKNRRVSTYYIEMTYHTLTLSDERRFQIISQGTIKFKNAQRINY